MPNSHSRSASFTIVVPVKNEDSHIIRQLVEQTHTAFRGTVDLVVVDDGSRIPVAVASIRHEISKGYGAALKAGIRYSKTKWIITMDGDGQHRIRDVERLIEFTKDFPEVAMVIGDRRLKEKSFIRYLGRKFLNTIASLLAWRWISDLNSGLRIFKREVATGYQPILCDHFSFTTSLTLAMLADSYKVDWLPVRVLQRPKGKSQVRVWKDGWVTLKYILWIGMALRTRRIRGWFRRIYS